MMSVCKLSSIVLVLVATDVFATMLSQSVIHEMVFESEPRGAAPLIPMPAQGHTGRFHGLQKPCSEVMSNSEMLGRT